MHRFYLAYGGGLGDVVWDYLRDPAARRVASLVEDFGCTVRVHTQCHNDGVLDLFRHHPHIKEHRSEDWRPPDQVPPNYFREPIDGYLPLQSLPHVLQAVGPITRLVNPDIFITDDESRQIAELLSVHPNVVIQGYAGLSDRDAFDRASLHSMVEALVHLEPKVRVILLGKNHPRTHKYAREEGVEHPNVLNLIDQLGIRASFHLVARCDAFVGCHSNLIRTAWDYRKRNALIVPDPLMTRVLPAMDPKYTYGLNQGETMMFTFPFDHGSPREFGKLDFLSVARHLLGRL